jgi:hypothetical protein
LLSRRDWCAALGLCLALWVAHTQAQPAAALPTGTLGETIGLNMKFTQGQPMSQLPMLEDLGVRWVRDTVGWSQVEPAAGQFVELPVELRQRLWYYRTHDIGVVVLLLGDNRAAYPPTTDRPLMNLDPEAFGRFATEVAKRFKAAGVRFVLEVWNEPHNTLKSIGGQWNGKPPSPWLDHYVKMVSETVRQVKAYDPGVKVINDDDMWVIHYWMLEAGLPSQLDGFAFHPYSGGPEVAAVAQDTDWMRPFVAVDKDGSFVSAVRRLRDTGTKKLGHEPEMWITEWGWPLGGDSVLGKVTEESLSAMLARCYIVAHAAGVKSTLWFSAIDSVDGEFGLLANNGYRRKPYFALKTLNQQLGAYQLRRQVLGASHPTTGVQAYLYGRDGDKTEQDLRLVIWSADKQTTARLALAGPLAQAKAFDVFGERVSPKVGAGGRGELMLGASPLYVQGLTGTLSELEGVVSGLK